MHLPQTCPAADLRCCARSRRAPGSAGVGHPSALCLANPRLLTLTQRFPCPSCICSFRTPAHYVCNGGCPLQTSSAPRCAVPVSPFLVMWWCCGSCSDRLSPPHPPPSWVCCPLAFSLVVASIRWSRWWWWLHNQWCLVVACLLSWVGCLPCLSTPAGGPPGRVCCPPLAFSLPVARCSGGCF